MQLIGDILVEAGCFLVGVLLGVLILMLVLRRAQKGLKDPWELEEEFDRLEEEEQRAQQKQSELNLQEEQRTQQKQPQINLQENEQNKSEL